MLSIAIVSLVVFTLLSWYLDRSINRFVRESVEESLNTLIKEERFSGRELVGRGVSNRQHLGQATQQ